MLITSNKSTKIKRSSNGNPFDLYLEVLIVTDKTIFNDHVRFASTNDTSLVFLHMRTYFAHYINGVRPEFVCGGF